jgi:hypothetical protein
MVCMQHGVLHSNLRNAECRIKSFFGHFFVFFLPRTQLTSASIIERNSVRLFLLTVRTVPRRYEWGSLKLRRNCSDFRAIFVWFSCDFGAIFKLFSCDFRAIFVRFSCDFRAIFVRFSCEFRAIFVRFSCEFRACTYDSAILMHFCYFRVIYLVYATLWLWSVFAIFVRFRDFAILVDFNRFSCD